MPLRVVYLDWSGTLALPKTKDAFLSLTGVAEADGLLYLDARTAIDILHSAGLRVGLIANTSAPHGDFVRALDRARLYFTGAIISAGGAAGGLPWRKPNARVFHAAMQRDGVLPHEAVMMGDNPNTDIVGAEAVGMRAVHVQRSAAHGHADTALLEAVTDLIRTGF